MKISKALVELGLARSGGEANRLTKQGAVQVGGCASDCTFFSTGRCTCGGWKKVLNPVEDVEEGIVVKVSSGFWRCLPRIDGRQGFDQLPGVGKVPVMKQEGRMTELKEEAV